MSVKSLDFIVVEKDGLVLIHLCIFFGFKHIILSNGLLLGFFPNIAAV